MFRIFIWLFEIGVIATLATVALAYVFARSRSIAGVLRAAATVVIAGVLSSLVGVGFGVAGAIGGAADPLSDGLIAMILSLPLTVWALDRVGRRRERVPARAGAGARTIEHAPRPRGDVAGDDRVAAAWRQAVRLAPMQRLRLASARDACLFALRHAEAYPLDVEAVECAVLIRRRLPELVEQTASYCTLADRAERRMAIDGLVADLDKLGRMALRRVEQSKVELGDTLAATRAHIASRTSETATF